MLEESKRYLLDRLPLRSRSKFIFDIVFVYKPQWDFKLKIIMKKNRNEQIFNELGNALTWTSPRHVCKMKQVFD